MSRHVYVSDRVGTHVQEGSRDIFTTEGLFIHVLAINPQVDRLSICFVVLALSLSLDRKERISLCLSFLLLSSPYGAHGQPAPVSDR